MVDFEYRIIYTYGGSLPSVAGEVVGRYLTNIQVVPGAYSVVWSYRLDFEEEHCGRSIWEHGPIQWPESKSRPNGTSLTGFSSKAIVRTT